MANQEQLPGLHDDGEGSERAFEAWLRDAAILPPASLPAPGATPGCGAASSDGAGAEGAPASPAAAPVRTLAQLAGGEAALEWLREGRVVLIWAAPSGEGVRALPVAWLGVGWLQVVAVLGC